VSTSIEPRTAPWPLVSPFEPYTSKALSLPPEPDFDITGQTPMLLLPAVTLGTLQYTTPPIADMPFSTRGLVTEASAKLAVWNGQDGRWSAWFIAEQFQAVYFPTGVSGWRRGMTPLTRVPRRGLDLIRATDALGLVHWTCAVPRDDDRFGFETVRLSSAIAKFELSQMGESSSAKRRRVGPR
jgi:hypothetical protein